MAIDHQILGNPGRDNALLVTVNSGQSIHRLLFDCGADCLSTVPNAHIQGIEAVFFSHFHIDHVAGFDHLLRMTWNRPDKPMHIFGPSGTVDIIHHRLLGFIWNLAAETKGEWIVTEIDGENQTSARFLSSEGFATRHLTQNDYKGRTFDVTFLELDHGTPSLAYTVREHPKTNIDPDKLKSLKLTPGPWLQNITDPALKKQLLTETPGDSIAYLTDFILRTPEDETNLVHFLKDCRTLVCENNYANAEANLAEKNNHMTSSGVANLATKVNPDHLILFHLSDRYTEEGWLAQLAEVQKTFPKAEFPASWFFDPISSAQTDSHSSV
jgi:ribonuclease Z